ncbi:MAG: transglycosylase SLT domain-containing protein [Thermomicrobiales bacterium]
MLGGERNVNTLTDVLFFARYPASKSRKLTRAEQKAWIRIRDRIVKPALKLLATSTPTPGVTRVITPTDPIVKNMARHESVINQVSQEVGFDANIVRGIIAAESGGRESLQASSGYTGLMQAGKGTAHLNPETSIRAGIANFNDKTASLARLLKPFGIDLQRLDRDTRVRLVMAGYNAGQRTAAKAIGFAHAAGSSADWMKPEHFQRALFQTGAYSVRNSSCLRVSDPAALTAALVNRYGQDRAALQGKYLLRSGWNTAGLLNTERQLLAKRAAASNLTLPQAQAVASPGLLCAVALKHQHLPGYTEKVIRYMHFFASRTSP